MSLKPQFLHQVFSKWLWLSYENDSVFFFVSRGFSTNKCYKSSMVAIHAGAIFQYQLVSWQQAGNDYLQLRWMDQSFSWLQAKTLVLPEDIFFYSFLLVIHIPPSFSCWFSLLTKTVVAINVVAYDMQKNAKQSKMLWKMCWCSFSKVPSVTINV